MCLTDESATRTNPNKVNIPIRKCDLNSSNYGIMQTGYKEEKYCFKSCCPIIVSSKY
jgi:hypothetical protein